MLKRLPPPPPPPSSQAFAIRLRAFGRLALTRNASQTSSPQKPPERGVSKKWNPNKGMQLERGTLRKRTPISRMCPLAGWQESLRGPPGWHYLHFARDARRPEPMLTARGNSQMLSGGSACSGLPQVEGKLRVSIAGVYTIPDSPKQVSRPASQHAKRPLPLRRARDAAL